MTFKNHYNASCTFDMEGGDDQEDYMLVCTGSEVYDKYGKVVCVSIIDDLGEHVVCIKTKEVDGLIEALKKARKEIE